MRAEDLVLTFILLIKQSIVLSRSVMFNSLQPHGLQPARLLCPWGFSRQEYWSGLPCSPPGDLPSSWIKPRCPALQVDSLPSEPPGKQPTTLPFLQQWVFFFFSLELVQKAFLIQKTHFPKQIKLNKTNITTSQLFLAPNYLLLPDFDKHEETEKG